MANVLLDSLSPERRALLVSRLREKGQIITKGQMIPRLPRDRESNVFPLSFAQEGLWFLNQLEPDNPFYNMPSAFRLMGSLNVAALERALNEITKRHEVLRTIYTMADGEPVQIVLPFASWFLPVIDLQEWPANQRDARARELVACEARRPFSLTQGPPFRIALLQLGDEDHVLFMMVHHIVADHWSIAIIVKELEVLYEAFSTWSSSPLPELPIQYADFAVWQRDWLKGEVLEKQLTYWRRQLDGVPSVLELPTSLSRPPIQTFQGASQCLRMSESLLNMLKSLSRQEGVTLFMLLLAAFNVLLYRYTGREDIVVGTPISSRNRVELEGLIGYFLNTLVLRTGLVGSMSFRQLLNRVQEVAKGAYAHQDLPFGRLLAELRPERNLSYHPLFQVMFNFQSIPMPTKKLLGLTVTPFSFYFARAQFDLNLYVEEVERELLVLMGYSTDLFDATTISRLAGHFQTLLEGIVADPEQAISDLPLLGGDERRQMLVEWNDTQIDYPRDSCIHELFEAQVERTPDAVAVVFEDQALTYAELNRRANQLAYYLRGLGVGPEVLAGICVERSPEMVVGILGVLKAGGSYVSMDAAYPKERHALMLEDAEVPVVLTQQKLIENLPQGKAHIVCMDADWETIAQERVTNPTNGTVAENLVYVMYTSGTTGRPKGIAVEHRQLHNYLNGILDRLDPPRDASFATVSTIAADLGNTVIFPSLCAGGCLHVISQERVSDPDAMADYFERRPIDCLKIVPSHLAALQTSLHPERVLPRYLLILGGEASHSGWVENLQTLSPNCTILNHYGPTEATVGVLTYRVDKDHPNFGVSTLPIGRPTANVQIYLLDQQLQPVPTGVPGEVHIGGANLARGYLNRPALTAERFVPNPFSQEPGTRLYRTGDLARYLSDGNIEFLGRTDHQVKVRGFRIELGEIEAVLSQHPAVREVVVLAREDEVAAGQPGNKRLVAYVVADEGQEPTVGKLRRFLQKKLPDYMVPSAFVTLNAFPLTPNGKIDRRALPAPEKTRPDLEGAFVAPRTPIEEMLAGIWTQILGLRQVGVHDNFFELGGHSLLATQVASRVCNVFEIELPLRALFEAPTIAGLGERIEEAQRLGRGLTVPPLMPASREGELPLSFAQERLWFLDQLVPDNPFYNIPAAVRMCGRLDIAALERTLNEVVRRHEVLRTTFAVVDGRPVQVIAPVLAVEMPVVDLRGLSDEASEAEARRLAREEAERPFDLARGPVLRVTLLRFGEEDHAALLTMHHIVSDGWSRGVVVREVGALYEAFSSGKPSPLPELPIQYADFAVWQRKWLQGEVLEEQLAYWRRQLEGAPAVLELPADRPRPPVPSFRGASLPFEISGSLSGGLKELGQREEATLFMVLLAAFGALLHRYTGQIDAVVGSPIANRNRKEIEGLIGFFVNTLVLPVDLGGDPTFRELLGRVREVTLGAYAHQDLPFEVLVEALQPERDLSRNPLFQVMFALQNVPRETLRLPGLTLELSSDSGAVRFDLECHLWEEPEGLTGSLVYNTDLFDDVTIVRMASHFQTLLQDIVEHPERELSRLRMISEEESQRLSSDFNDDIESAWTSG